MSKIIYQTLTTFVFLFLSVMFPMLASASITPNNLVSKLYDEKTCVFPNAVNDLEAILQNNSCSDEAYHFDNEEISLCSRVALTQYTLCRYVTVLNNYPTVTNNDTFNNSKKTTADNEVMTYNPNITTPNDNANQTPKHKIFNWF